MKRTPRISEAEFEVMKAVWEKSPITANEIVEMLSPKADRSPTTVKTMISRLLKKGALSFEVEGKSYLYSPKVRREDCVAMEADSFLNRMFDGALMPMIAHFAKSRPLSPDEIKRLKEILDKEG